jgi:hypothetical protein
MREGSLQMRVKSLPTAETLFPMQLPASARWEVATLPSCQTQLQRLSGSECSSFPRAAFSNYRRDPTLGTSRQSAGNSVTSGVQNFTYASSGEASQPKRD